MLDNALILVYVFPNIRESGNCSIAVLKICLFPLREEFWSDQLNPKRFPITNSHSQPTVAKNQWPFYSLNSFKRSWWWAINSPIQEYVRSAPSHFPRFSSGHTWGINMGIKFVRIFPISGERCVVNDLVSWSQFRQLSRTAPRTSFLRPNLWVRGTPGVVDVSWWSGRNKSHNVCLRRRPSGGPTRISKSRSKLNTAQQPAKTVNH